MFAKTNENGGVSIANTQLDDTWVEVTGLPDSRSHRDAWVLNGSVIEIDPTKGAEVDHKIYKANREVAVDALVVEVDGLQFDGDERSQDRMTRAVASSSSDTETTQWKLADNTVATVTAGQLKTALRLAGQAQTTIWMEGYTND